MMISILSIRFFLFEIPFLRFCIEKNRQAVQKRSRNYKKCLWLTYYRIDEIILIYSSCRNFELHYILRFIVQGSAEMYTNGADFILEIILLSIFMNFCKYLGLGNFPYARKWHLFLSVELSSL